MLKNRFCGLSCVFFQDADVQPCHSDVSYPEPLSPHLCAVLQNLLFAFLGCGFGKVRDELAEFL